MKNKVIKLLKQEAYPIIISKKIVMLVLDNKLIVMTLKHGIQEFSCTDSVKALPMIAQDETIDFGCSTITELIDACNDFKLHENFIYNIGFLITALDELDWTIINYFFKCAANYNFSGNLKEFILMAGEEDINISSYRKLI